jgi:hypothetical protein
MPLLRSRDFTAVAALTISRPVHRAHTQEIMRAEIESLAEAAKQSIGLLRRHL